MKYSSWKKHHKWSGAAVCLLLILMCISGILLNHRTLISGIDINRKYLPSWYYFKNWNNGLQRGTVSTGQDSIIIYGAGGAFLTDDKASSIKDFNNGIDPDADLRQIRAAVRLHGSSLFISSNNAVYRLAGEKWEKVLSTERLSDMTAKGDTLVVAGRSELYISCPPYKEFKEILIPASPDNDNKITLFRTVWTLHSGKMFGNTGILVADILALVIIFLSLSGIIYWIMPGVIKRFTGNGKRTSLFVSTMKHSGKWHDRIGKYTFPLTLLIVFTGWLLRPPALIPLALTKTSPVPGTSLDNNNKWEDKLRMIRFDETSGEWLMSTSDGFFSMHFLGDVPVRIKNAPPVSVMGLNVWQKDNDGKWICGSFSGIYKWDQISGSVTDFFSGETIADKAVPPFGKFAASGYSSDFSGKTVVAEYYKGTGSVRQPEELSSLPLLLWNVSLEVHTGRIFIGPIATYIFILILGGTTMWCLISGWKVRRKVAVK